MPSEATHSRGQSPQKSREDSRPGRVLRAGLPDGLGCYGLCSPSPRRQPWGEPKCKDRPVLHERRRKETQKSVLLPTADPGRPQGECLSLPWGGAAQGLW